MGMSPHDFYSIAIEDFMLKGKGFIDARIDGKRDLRRLAAIIQSPHVDKKAPSMMSQWPIAKDEEIKQQISDYVSEQAKITLDRHAKGGFVYVKENGRMIAKKITD